MRSPLHFFLLGRWGRAPTIPVQLRVGFRILHHELDVLHVPETREADSVWQKDEEDAGDDDEGEADREETERVKSLLLTKLKVQKISYLI